MKTKFSTFILLFAIGFGIEGCKKNLETISLNTGDFPEEYIPGETQNNCEDTVKAGDLFLLEGTVVDAEFDVVNHNIFLVTRDPGNGYTVGLNFQNPRQTALTSIPTCISVVGNKEVAVIGYDGKLDFMDLKNLFRKGSVYVPFYVDDIAAVGQDIAYAFPLKTTGWEGERIYRIGLLEDSVYKHSDIKAFQQARVKSSPTGKFLFVSDYNSGLTKLSLEADSLTYLHSEFLEQHATWQNLWVPEPGNKIIGSDGGIYNNDLNHVGYLAETGEIMRSLDYSHEKYVYCGILANSRDLGEHQGKSEISVFNSETLELLNTYPVPTFSVEGVCYMTDAHYIFLDDQYSTYYVIVEGQSADNDVKWAVIKGDILELY